MVLTIDEIKEILPQDYPFVMIDRVIEYKENKSLVAVKNVTANEWIFTEALNGNSILPEPFIIEAAAQAAIVLYSLMRSKRGDSHPIFLLGRVKAEFIGPVKIGDQLNICAEAVKVLDKGGVTGSRIYVENSDVAKVNIVYGIQN